MQFEKFVASDMRAALAAVRQAMGEDAVIVATRQLKKRGFLSRGQVEVMATHAERSSKRAAPVPVPVPVPDPDPVAPLPAAPPSRASSRSVAAYAQQQQQPSHEAAPSPPSFADNLQLQDAIGPLRAELQVMRAALAQRPPMPLAEAAPQLGGADAFGAQMKAEMGELKRLLASVTLGGVSFARAAQAADRAILEAADVDPEVADALLADLQVSPRDDEPLVDVAKRLKAGIAFALPTVGDFFRQGPPRRIALVGPTGVGKTTTVAKIAAHAALRHNMRVALISLDTYRIGAQEQLAQYARLVGVPMAMAHDRRSFSEALAQFEDVDLLLIDTAGRAPNQAGSHCLLLRQMFHQHSVEVFVTLAAATRRFERQEMLAAMGELSALGARALILTKLDEAVALGSCLSLTHQTGLPLAFVTHGQRVPEDLAIADGQMLAQHLVDRVLQSKSFHVSRPCVAPPLAVYGAI